jgi:hypothetical protein
LCSERKIQPNWNLKETGGNGIASAINKSGSAEFNEINEMNGIGWEKAEIGKIRNILRVWKGWDGGLEVAVEIPNSG